ncbi:MAG: hypothetical protein JJU20_05690 [Opitutales bacterium]|nr:hypothetical protein [Opitutales bacterium]
MEVRPIPCPYLPSAAGAMTHRCLTAFGAERSAAFYLTALRYSQCLWLRDLPARSILSLCRALYAPMGAGDTVLKAYPLPYLAYRWLIENARNAGFLGNPRVSFQHQAARIRGTDQDLLRARAHALWWLTRRSRPELGPDPECEEPEDSIDAVLASLARYGIQPEPDWFRAAADYSLDSTDSASKTLSSSTGRRSGPSE